MRFDRTRGAAIFGLLLVLACVASSAFAQKSLIIQANARGTGTQLGRLFNLNIHIDQFSTPEEQSALLNAFAKQGNDGVLDALNRMSAKGRLAIPGTVGYTVKYIREFPTENGRRFRLLTDRIIAFGENWGNTRSRDYNLSAIEVTVTPDGKGEGVLLPACKFKPSKTGGDIELETFQNPWQLSNLMVYEK